MKPQSEDHFEALPLPVKQHIRAVRLRYAQSWKTGETPSLEEFLEGVADSEREPLLRELLRLEIHHRRRKGDQPSAAELLRRFPHHEQLIHTLLDSAAEPRHPEQGNSVAQAEDSPVHAQPQPAPVRPERPRSAWPEVPGYQIESELGKGGMGVVYKAQHRELDRAVALKMIRGGSDAGDAELARFRIEARAVARLQHPHIVQIYEVGEHDGLPFFALE